MLSTFGRAVSRGERAAFAQIVFSERETALRQLNDGCSRGAALTKMDNKNETRKAKVDVEMKWLICSLLAFRHLLSNLLNP
jgi:hypothetical protein